jgi:hypothetical protein
MAFASDVTNAYNGAAYGNFPYNSYNDVLSASRSLIYLRGTNQVVYYDRADVGHAASTQKLDLITTGPITLAGQSASWLTRSGNQKAYYTSLLPAGATVADAGLPCPSCTSDQVEDWEPDSTIEVTPSGTPTSTRFLSVLEWGSSSLTKTSTSLVQSSSGTNFDGALVGSSLVMFKKNWSDSLSTVTFAASGATTIYLSDLTPNTTYTITGTGTPGTATTDTAGVLEFTANGTGNITVAP